MRSVASFTDAWIETTTWLMPLILSPVASFTDAWIETVVVVDIPLAVASRIFYRCVD